MKIHYKFILILLSGASIFFSDRSLSQLSQEEICSAAKESNIKVFNSTAWGSGVIISKEVTPNSPYFTYTVITNDHVLDEGISFVEVQSSDQQLYKASILVRYLHSSETGYDLAVLQFESAQNYKVVSINEWDRQSELISTGISLFTDPKLSDDDGFLCSEFVHVSRYLEHEMMGGYQLGYSFGVRQGMSGGGIYDHFGHLVGINGKGRAVIASAESYLYRDRTLVQQDLSLSMPLEAAQILLRESSWGISVKAIAYLLPSGLSVAKIDPKENISNSQ